MSCEDGVNEYTCNCLPGYEGVNCQTCHDPRDCNLSDGCCLGSIVFNSNRELPKKSRDILKNFTDLTDFFGIYQLNSYEKLTGRMIFQKGKNLSNFPKIMMIFRRNICNQKENHLQS